MQEDREWIWVTGNHDPKIGERLGGTVVGDIEVEGIVLRHEPAAGRRDARDRRAHAPRRPLSLHGYSMRRPCFVGNGRRLVMPAFGTYAGGLNILDDAFEPLFGDDGLRVWMLGQEGLYPVAARLLKGRLSGRAHAISRRKNADAQEPGEHGEDHRDHPVS